MSQNYLLSDIRPCVKSGFSVYHMDSLLSNVNSLSDVVLKDVGEKSSDKKPLLFEPAVSITIVSKVIPTKKLIRVRLPHSGDSPSVCLIVKDVNKRDHNKTTDAWKLRWKTDYQKRKESVNLDMPTILPLRELTLAFQPFGAKQRLANSFDLFLADRRIVHHLPTKLGKAFYGRSRGKVPVPVTLSNRNICDVVAHEMSSILYHIRGNGCAESFPVGTLEMPVEKLKENIVVACEKLCSAWPDGGLDNIRSIYLQYHGTNIPLYFDASELPNSEVARKLSSSTAAGSLATKPSKSKVIELLSKVSENLPEPDGDVAKMLARKKKQVPGFKFNTRPKRKTKPFSK